MALDETNIAFSSEWDIDQLSDEESTTLTFPANTFSLTYVTLKSLSLSDPPIVDAIYKVSGDSVWRQLGDTSSVTLLQLPLILGVTSSAITLGYYNYNSSDITITIRYYIWTDKVNY